MAGINERGRKVCGSFISMFSFLAEFDNEQIERRNHKMVKRDKQSLIKTTMKRYNIQFELAEHIVELALGDKDLSKLTLMDASRFIVEAGDSLGSC